MTDELILKVINDLTDIPSSVSFDFSPFKVSDPFSEKRLFDVIDLMNDKLLNAGINLHTKASLVTPAKIESLASRKNIRYLWISLNDHRKEVDEQLMAIPFDRTIANMELIHERKREGRFPIHVTVGKVQTAPDENRAFRAWMLDRFPLFDVMMLPKGDWLGQVDTTAGEIPPLGCLAWFDFSITATGVVAFCCIDGAAEYPIGNVSKQHVLEIYNAPALRAIRESELGRAGLEPCNRCTVY